MATRNDVTPDYYDSPRVLEVAAPSVEMTMQDLVDTARKLEDRFDGISWPKLLNASGKEDLGGGVQVGITVTQQNTRLAFEGRTTPARIGTVTSVPGSPIAGRDSFIDTGADFVAANVARGSLVINFTDNSIAEVRRVLSATQLETKLLVNGTTNQYSINDDYQVYNIVQCNATGGNLVAVDDANLTIPSILPTAFTQVVLTASSSATQTESQDIQYASFNGGVTYDAVGGVAGTTFPAGTPRQPVNNWSDALAIAIQRGFVLFYIIGDATIGDGSEDFTQFTFQGQGPNITTMTLPSAPIFTNCVFRQAVITGTLDGNATIRDSVVEGLTFVSGVVVNCILNPGTLTLGGNETAIFINCASAVPGAGTPVIDFGGSGQPLAVRNYSGGMRLINKSGGESASIDLNSGQVIIDSDVTSGIIILRGIGKFVDNGTGAQIVDELIDSQRLSEVWQRLGLDPDSPLTTNDDNSITFAGVTIDAENFPTSTRQTRQP